MTKGWRNNIALVERRERLAKERFERRLQGVKLEIEMRKWQEDVRAAREAILNPSFKLVA